MKERKQELRSRIRDEKRRIGAEELRKMSDEVAEKLLTNQQYVVSEVVMLYSALWDEVNVDLVLEDALNRGKGVICPTVVGDDIVPVEITKSTVWRQGAFGIMEPDAEKYEGKIDLVVVPGVAFDGCGNRLGRGKGYYDRFLLGYEGAYLIGVCFGFQFVDSVPQEEFDFVMDEVVVVEE